MYVSPGSLLMAVAILEESIPVGDMLVAEDVGIVRLERLCNGK